MTNQTGLKIDPIALGVNYNTKELCNVSCKAIEREIKKGVNSKINHLTNNGRSTLKLIKGLKQNISNMNYDEVKQILTEYVVFV